VAIAPALWYRRISSASSEARSVGLRRALWPESGAISPIPALDGLRAVAVLLVLVFHAWFERDGYIVEGQLPQDFPIFYGRTGVQLFFVLSGFLLFLPYAKWLFGLQAQPSARLFYRRRALRVVPAYWVSLLILLPTVPLTAARLLDGVAHAAFLSNALPDSVYTINGVFWTMAIEVQFYVLLPIMAWATVRVARRTRPLLGLVALAIATMGISALADRLSTVDAVANLPQAGLLVGQPSVWNWLAVFCCGMLVAAAYVYVRQVWRPALAARRMLTVAATAAFCAGIGLAVAIAFVPALHKVPMKTQLYGMAYAAVLAGLVFGPRVLRYAFELRVVRFVGLISYSFYIWHTIVLAILAPALPTAPSVQLAVVRLALVGLPASIAVAYVSYMLSERPFLGARKQAHERGVTTAVAPAVASRVAA
jgi:peptidoglycan/LPS O-acetylase OafA/YrhL